MEERELVEDEVTAPQPGRPLIPRWLRRLLIVVLIAPFGAVCLAFPFYYIFVGPLGSQLLADTKGMLGAGRPVEKKIHQVVCVAHRTGTSSRGHTEYECTVFPTVGPVWRIERTCATNRSGQIPTVRLLSDDPVQYAVSWGPWELLWRYVSVVGFPLIVVFGFGCACMWVTVFAWNRS